MTASIVRLRFEPRLEMSRWLNVATPLIGVVLALVVGGVVLRFAGAPDPLETYAAVFEQAFGTPVDWVAGGRALLTGTPCEKGLLCFAQFSDTLVKATPILLAGLGVALAFRMRLWNIGAEGQLFMGAWMATGVALFWLPRDTPQPVMLLAMAVAGMVGGALWGAIPGLLRAVMNVNEIITTLMLNYIAFQWLTFWVVAGPWSQGGFQITPPFPRSAWLPRLTDYAKEVPSFAGLTAHLGIVLGLIAAIILWIVLSRSRWGYEIRVIGDNPNAARYAGMSLVRNIVIVMMLSGALAGLAGMAEVAGVVHALQDRFSPGYGFTAIIVAWLAKLHPLAVIPVSILFGGLLVGTKQIQPAGIASMLQGVILFTIIGTDMLARYRLRIERASQREA